MSVSSARTPETFTPILKKLINSPGEFGVEDNYNAFHHLLSPASTTPEQISSFLTGLHLTGVDKRSEIISAAADVLHFHSVKPTIDGAEDFVVDIVGTGGDGWNTFNVSTTAAIVAAGAGARVLKASLVYHGNKAQTSKSGSADLLKALGCPLVLLSPTKTLAATPENPYVSRVLTEPLPRIPFQFLLAPDYHPALSLVGPIRKILPFRTIFNILGPLVNPAKPKGMIVGVAAPWLGPVFAQALKSGGVQRAIVVCGREQLDELSCAGETDAWRFDESGEIIHFTLHPNMFGLSTHPLSKVSGGDADENASIFKRILDPATRGDTIPEDLIPILDFILINAGALLVVANIAKDWKEGAALARQSIMNGKAWDALVQFREAGNKAIHSK